MLSSAATTHSSFRLSISIFTEAAAFGVTAGNRGRGDTVLWPEGWCFGFVFFLWAGSSSRPLFT